MPQYLSARQFRPSRDPGQGCQDGVVSEQPVPTGRPNARLRQSIGDMIRSMVVVLVVVGALLAVTWRPQPDAVKVVDIQQVLTVAQMQAAFEPRVPTGISGLQPTSVRWEPTAASGDTPVWHVGYVVDGRDYLQVSQSQVGDSNYLAEQTAGGEPGGNVMVQGAPWTVWTSPERVSLVQQAGGVTTIVSGTVDVSQLEVVARSLSVN